MSCFSLSIKPNYFNLEVNLNLSSRFLNPNIFSSISFAFTIADETATPATPVIINLTTSSISIPPIAIIGMSILLISSFFKITSKPKY